MKALNLPVYLMVAAIAATLNVTTYAEIASEAPSPAPLVLEQLTAAAQGTYEAEIAAQCAVKGCDAGLVTAVMYCESGGDPDAYHPNPYGGADVGLFQINDETWGEAVAWGGPWVQIDWATTMIANGGIHHWWPSQHCWGG